MRVLATVESLVLSRTQVTLPRLISTFNVHAEGDANRKNTPAQAELDPLHVPSRPCKLSYKPFTFGVGLESGTASL